MTGRTILDAATGSVWASLDNAEGIPCSQSPFPPPVLVSSAGLVTAPGEGKQSTVLSATVDRDSRCIVTDDGRQVAFDDAGGRVHLWSLVDRREVAVRFGPEWELYDESGARLLSGSLGARGELALTPDGRRVVIRDDDGLTVLDAENGRVVSRVECKECSRIVASAEPRRLFTSSGKRLALWTIGSPEPIWTDSDRVGNVADGMAISDDGNRVAWINGTTAYVHTVGSPTELEATFDENVSDLKFSNDGKRLLIASRGEIALWSLSPWKRLWRVPSPASSFASLEWSTDDRVLLADYRTLGTVLLDAATGHHLATVPLSKPRAVSPEDKVLPSLNGRISQGAGRWELWSFPEPGHSSPRESLARIATATGLQLLGAELVDTVPGPVDQ